jgi:tetratricopeptide (TPR) repeat protein
LIYDGAMPLTPDDLREVHELAAQHEFDAAIKLCADFIAEHPDHPHGYHLRAVVRVLMGEPHVALADRDKVVSLCPHEAGAYMARADDHLRLGDYAAAAADLDRAEKFDTGDYAPMIPMLRGHCHARLRHVDAALADLSRVVDDYVLTGFGDAVPTTKPQLAAEIEAARRDGSDDDVPARPEPE